MTDAERTDRIERVLRTLITWIAASSVGIISIEEAGCLLRDLSPRKKKHQRHREKTKRR